MIPLLEYEEKGFFTCLYVRKGRLKIKAKGFEKKI